MWNNWLETLITSLGTFRATSSVHNMIPEEHIYMELITTTEAGVQIKQNTVESKIRRTVWENET